MALRKPLVIVSGKVREIASSDTLDAAIAEIEILSLVNGEAGAITVGQAVYISGSDTVKKAKADASGTSDVTGFVVDTTIASSASGSIQTGGTLTGLSGLTAGSRYYLSAATAGAITTTPPSGSGQFIVPVGFAVNTTDILIEFEPSIQLA